MVDRMGSFDFDFSISYSVSATICDAYYKLEDVFKSLSPLTINVLTWIYVKLQENCIKYVNDSHMV